MTVVIAGSVGAIGAVAEAAGIRSGEGWHLPSPLWALVLLAAWIVAQQLVIAERRRERDAAIEAAEQAGRQQTVVHRADSSEATREQLAELWGRPERERQRQELVLRDLHAEFLEAHPGRVTPAVRHRNAPLPKGWVERRLGEMGEAWRRESYWPPRD